MHTQNFDTIDRLSFFWLGLSKCLLLKTKIEQNTFDCIKKCQQNIEPVGDLLEQQIHIATVRSFTKWVEMFFEVAFKDPRVILQHEMGMAKNIADKDSP